MELSLLLTGLYLYSGPALIVLVFVYVTCHVWRDWREHVR